MPIYGENLGNIFVRARCPIVVYPDMKLRGLKLYLSYLNADPGLTLSKFTTNMQFDKANIRLSSHVVTRIYFGVVYKYQSFTTL